MSLSEVNQINEYLNKDFTCTCGRKHSVTINSILISEHAVRSLPGLLKSSGFHKAYLIFDSSTFRIAGKLILENMKQENMPCCNHILKETEPVPDEKSIGEVLIHYDSSCDVIIAVGSGTINDLSRFISFRLGLPYIIAATAPSMDGFASNVAPLIVNHMKTTYEAHAPYAILGDLSILQNAPMKMITAGIGDILGKYTCLCDWEIAHVITGEYHCKEIEGLVRKSIHTVVESIQQVSRRSPDVIKNIMEALILSGIAMSFAGNSRPASGSEHHLSHYWEMMYLFEGKAPVLHGTKVGIGTIAVLKAYELLMQKKIDFSMAREKAGCYSRELWDAKMKETYFEASQAVIDLEQETGKNCPENVINRVNKLEAEWPRIKAITEKLPAADAVRAMLSSLGAPATPMSVGIDKTTFLNSFLVAKELRNRFGLLQILFDLSLTEEIAEQVWEYYQ